MSLASGSVAGHGRANRTRADSSLRVRSTRYMLTVATLLVGLSIAVPSMIMVFVWPGNRAIMRCCTGGMWTGEIWWQWPWTGAVLSLLCGISAIILTIWGRVPPATAKPSNPHRLAVVSGLVLTPAVVCLILAPVLYIWFRSTGLGAVLALLGLGGIAAAVAGVAVSDLHTVRRWLLPVAWITLPLTVLGSLYLVFLFGTLTLVI